MGISADGIGVIPDHIGQAGTTLKFSYVNQADLDFSAESDANIEINTNSGNPYDGSLVRKLHPSNPIDIQCNAWHKGVNNSDNPAPIVEVWKGRSELLTEDDIERWD